MAFGGVDFVNGGGLGQKVIEGVDRCKKVIFNMCWHYIYKNKHLIVLWAIQ